MNRAPTALWIAFLMMSVACLLLWRDLREERKKTELPEGWGIGSPLTETFILSDEGAANFTLAASIEPVVTHTNGQWEIRFPGKPAKLK